MLTGVRSDGIVTEVVARQSPAKRPSGFTLIELLVVVSIVAMLMALLLPVIHRVRRQAQAVACQGGMHGWAVMFAAYQNDNDGRFPPSRHWVADKATGVPLGPDTPWPRQMEMHSGLDLRKALLCPAASRLQLVGTFRTRGAFVACGATFEAWYWGDPRDGGNTEGTCSAYNGSYAMNNYLRRAGRIEWIKPSVLPAFFDSRDCLAGFPAAEQVEPPPCEDAPLTGGFHYQAAKVALDRHQAGINMLFVDAAIRKVDIKELWTLSWNEEYNTAGPWTKAGGVLPEDWPAWMRKFKDY